MFIKTSTSTSSIMTATCVIVVVVISMTMIPKGAALPAPNTVVNHIDNDNQSRMTEPAPSVNRTKRGFNWRARWEKWLKLRGQIKTWWKTTHLDEGYDIVYTPDQFVRQNPGSLKAYNDQICDADQTKGIENPDGASSANQCKAWCVQADTLTQQEFIACQYNKNTKKCLAFGKSSFTAQNGNFGTKPETDQICWSLQAHGRRQNRAMRTSGYWPDNEIVYRIVDEGSSNAWDSHGLSYSTAVNYINQAINAYHTQTNIRFKERTTESDYIYIGYFTGGCSSYVGKIGGAQRVTLGWCYNRLGSIIHEFGHALGLYHEQSRADRDAYITISSNANSNFNIQSTNSRGLPYDFGSLMHYPMSTTWTNNDGSQYTVVMSRTTQGDQRWNDQGNPTIGQRLGLSDLDIAGLNIIYPQTPGQVPTPAPVPIIVDQGTISPGVPVSGSTIGGKSLFGNPAPDHTYSFSVSSTNTYTFSVCGGASWDTYLRVYRDENNGQFTQVAANDDFCGLQSTISEQQLSPANYIVLIEGFSSNAGFYTLTMTTAAPTTAAPTTRAPTTASPTTGSPTTASPTTVSPTTPAPTTGAPTTSPVTSSPTVQGPPCHYTVAGGSNKANTKPTTCQADDTSNIYVRCCADGVDPYPAGKWERLCAGVWAASFQFSAESEYQSCPSAMTWAEADQFCTGAGGRLCTKTELENDCTKGTGCSRNKEWIWSSDTE